MSNAKQERGNYADRQLFFRLLKLVRPYRFIFITAATLSIVLAPLAILRPYLVQLSVDEYILAGNYQGLLWIVGLLFGVLLFEGALQYFFTYITGLLGQSVIKDLRLRVFKHINSLRLSYFDRTPIGNSTTRTINDIETINTVFSQGAITIVADVLTLFFVLGIMLYSSWSLTLVCLTTLPLLIWGSYWFKEAVKKAYESVRTEVSKMNAFLQERISGMRIVQIFNAEQQELKKFDAINNRYTEANIRSIFIMRSSSLWSRSFRQLLWA